MSAAVPTDPPVKRARQKNKLGDKGDSAEKHDQLNTVTALKKSKRDKKNATESTGTAKDLKSTRISVEDTPSTQPANGKKRKKEEPLKVDTEKDEGIQNRKKPKKTNTVDGKTDGGEVSKSENGKKKAEKRADVISRQADKLREKVIEADEVTLVLKEKGKEGRKRQEKVAFVDNEASRRSRRAEGEKKKSKSVLKVPSPEPLAEEEWGGVQDAASSDDESVHLHGFSTDDDDSSDEDDGMDDEHTTLDVVKLPTISKDDAAVKRKLEKARRQPTDDRGVLYLGRIPHGMYEDQLRSYFSQFGDITRLRLSRNKRTGRSKSYAFIEFSSSSVAQIVADTMDNYLLTGHILCCKLIPKNEVHPELWIGANRKYRVVPQDRISRDIRNKPRTEDERSKAERRLIKRQKQKQRKLAEAGIKYDFGPIAYKQA